MHVLLTLILFLKFTFLDTKSVMKKEVEAEEEEVAALKHAVGVKNLPLFPFKHKTRNQFDKEL